MKKAILFVLLLSSTFSLNAALWRGLTESNWYAGPKITEEDLTGRVVMIDKWGVFCPPCRALLPKMQNVWSAFKNKNFVLIGSHCQGRKVSEVNALVKEHKLTFPIYDSVGLAANEPTSSGIPFLYVVNHRGKVVYSGHNHNAAMEAAQEAIVACDLPPTLLGNVILDKKSPYKALEKQLILGKNVSSVIKKLEVDIKAAEKRLATEAQKTNAQVAKEILAAIEEARVEIPKEIEAKKSRNPEEALKLLKDYIKTFPKEGAELKKQIPEMTKQVAAWKKEQKAKQAEAKKKR